MLPLLLALAASAAWGSADFLGGRASRGMAALSVTAFSKVAGAVGLGLVCVVAGESPSAEEAAWAVGSGVFGAAGSSPSTGRSPSARCRSVAPLTACGGALPMLVALAGGELPGPVTGAGLALAFAGAVVVSRPPQPGAAAPGMRRAALAYALAAAAGLGLALTLLQQGAQAPGDSALGLALVAAVSAVALLVPLTASRGGGPPSAALLPAVMGCGLLDVAANVLFVEASARGEQAVVAVLGSLYPLATVLLARAWLGERLSASQGAGVVAAVLGVAAIAAGA
jgi:drug/metabolite transporter (DMT)-like permease